MLRHLIEIQHLLTPVAIVRRVRNEGNIGIAYTTLHIFGLRVAYWTNLPPA